MEKPSHVLLSDHDWNRFMDFMLSDKEPTTKQLLWIAEHVYKVPYLGQERLFPMPDFRPAEDRTLELDSRTKQQIEAERMAAFAAWVEQRNQSHSPT